VSDEENPHPRRWHFIAALLADMRLAWAMILGTAIYGVLSWLDIPAFPCPWKSLTNLPCPGCGMTRSSFSLLHGRFLESLQYNALTWVLLLFWLIIAIGVAIPARYRKVFVEKIGHWEQRTRWGLWFAGIVAIYTLTRWVNFL
jgi:hypothetical protein